MPGKILPDKALEQYLRSGLKDTQIVARLRKDHDIAVTRQAISAWRKRRGMEMRPQSPRAMPWRLRPEHRQMEAARAIRLYARRERGEPIPPEEQARLDRTLAHLEEADGVFHYDPDSFPDTGWVIVRRRPGVDHGIIREP